jgi:hypothetical protein
VGASLVTLRRATMFTSLLRNITGDEEDTDDGFVNVDEASDDTDAQLQIKSEICEARLI